MMRILTLLTLAGIVGAGILVFVNSAGEAGQNRIEYATLDQVLLGVSWTAFVVALIFGASFVGAEWQKETIATTLTWEPRRLRLISLKLAAVFIGCFVFALAAQALLAAALYPAAAAHGSMAGVDTAWVTKLFWLSVRIAAVAGGIGVLGASLGT